MPQRARLLLVAGDSESLAPLRRALADHEVLTATSGAEAWKVFSNQYPDLILAASVLPDMSGLELLRRCRVLRPGAPSVLWASFAELPQLIRLRAKQTVNLIVPRPGTPEILASAVAKALGLPERATARGAAPAPPFPLDLAGARETLRWTVRAVVALSGRVVRPPPARGAPLQLQFVCAVDTALTDLRHRLAEAWGPALKPVGKRTTFGLRRHPVVGLLGDLARDQELFALSAGEGLDLYLALLPWADGRSVTLILGLSAPPKDPDVSELVAELHQVAVSDLSHLTVPTLEPAPEGVQYLPDYDLVAAKDYVGPDRRREQTPVANRFAFVGRRKQVAAGWRHDRFVDRLGPWGLAFLIGYGLLALFDAFCTQVYISRGPVAAINPLLRPLLDLHPWPFVLAKNALCLTAFFVFARFQLFRLSRLLLPVVLGATLALDLYWIFLLSYLQ